MVWRMNARRPRPQRLWLPFSTLPSRCPPPQALLAPGDHVVCTFPGYQSLYECAQSIGCEVSRWCLARCGAAGMGRRRGACPNSPLHSTRCPLAPPAQWPAPGRHPALAARPSHAAPSPFY